MLLAYAEDRVGSYSMYFILIKNTPHLLGEAYVSPREKVISRKFQIKSNISSQISILFLFINISILIPILFFSYILLFVGTIKIVTNETSSIFFNTSRVHIINCLQFLFFFWFIFIVEEKRKYQSI